ncbi:MFS general substrate transporter [Echria macrotheca]|uniref:MFS general substrate transporter n=1 Tax=Echria macrotheca TaxID=438768 RepID=A0AAJ0BL28_9PEZI|nr:MFS general substrate transporter [Echria macrotheca]
MAESDGSSPSEEKDIIVPTGATPDEFPHSLRLVLLVGAVMLTVWIVALDQTIVGTAIPRITDEFHGIEDVSWYGAAYFLCLGGFQSSWGKAFRYFPLKTSFLVSLFIFELGSLVCGLAPSSKAFIAGRAIAGVGGAGVTGGATVIFAVSVEPRRRPNLNALIGVAYLLGAVLGPLIGGGFADGVTWRWCFYINLPVGGLAAALVVIFFRPPVRDTKDAETPLAVKLRHMDLVGAVLVMGAVVCFILAMQYGGVTDSWGSGVVVGLLVGCVLITTALGAWEYFEDEYAMLPPRLLRHRWLWAGGLFQLFYAGTYFVLLYYLPIYFQSIRGVDALGSAVDTLPLMLAGFVSMMIGGVVITVTGHAMPFMVLSSAIITVGNGLLFTLNTHTPSAKWIGYQVLVGFPMSFSFQNSLNILQANAAPEDLPTATTVNFLFQQLGGGLGVAAAQAAFANRLLVNLAVLAPEVDPHMVLTTGAAELQSVFSGPLLGGVVASYMQGIKTVFAFAIGLSGMAFLMGLLVPAKRLHKPAAATVADVDT